MDPPANRNEVPDRLRDLPPVRPRGADLVTEARIIRAGGGAARISPYFQALVYLLLLAALLLVIWSVWLS